MAKWQKYTQIYSICTYTYTFIYIYVTEYTDLCVFLSLDHQSVLHPLLPV